MKLSIVSVLVFLCLLGSKVQAAEATVTCYYPTGQVTFTNVNTAGLTASAGWTHINSQNRGTAPYFQGSNVTGVSDVFTFRDSSNNTIIVGTANCIVMIPNM